MFESVNIQIHRHTDAGSMGIHTISSHGEPLKSRKGGEKSERKQYGSSISGS